MQNNKSFPPLVQFHTEVLFVVHTKVSKVSGYVFVVCFQYIRILELGLLTIETASNFKDCCTFVLLRA